MREAGRRLAAAGFADQAQGLAARHLEAHAVDGRTVPTCLRRIRPASPGNAFRPLTLRTVFG
jgi:hypothetical protein